MGYLTGLMLALQSIPKPESFWPQSVAGWIGLGAGVISISVIIYDRITGRASNWRDIKNDIKDLCDRLEKEEAATKSVNTRLEVMNTLLTGIDHELRGVGGDNGIRQSVKDIRLNVAAILVRNQKMDIKAAVFEKMLKHSNYDGPERRQVIRQLKDLMPEEEEPG